MLVLRVGPRKASSDYSTITIMFVGSYSRRLYRNYREATKSMVFAVEGKLQVREPSAPKP